MFKIKLLIFALMLFSMPFLLAFEKSAGEANNAQINSNALAYGLPDAGHGPMNRSTQNCDPKIIIPGNLNCDPKMIIRGNPDIDPEFLFNPYNKQK
ncbi:MAG: hypothetical protein QHH06_05955 [Clostridiales bacterium]|nr:hypothetical protein [Eubacteriales bacterium]MDH7566007.1 hypothetical protein [Clostridiales bacterium]